MDKIEILRFGWVANWLVHVLAGLIFLIILQTNCFALSISDLNRDGIVDLFDFEIMALQWLVIDTNNPLEGNCPSDIYIPPDTVILPPDINVSPVVPTEKSHKTFAAVKMAALRNKQDRVIFVDDFEDATQWRTYYGSISNGRVNAAFRDKCMLTVGGTQSSFPIMIYRNVNNLNFNTCTFRLRYYIQSNTGLTRGNGSVPSLAIFFDAGNNLARYAEAINIPVEEGIWHDIIFTSSELLCANGFDFATDNVNRIWILCAGNTLSIPDRPIIYFDRLKAYRDDLTRPAGVVIGLDDGWAKLPDSQYEGLMYAAQKGVRTYCALATDQIGVNPDYMTWQQVTDLYDTGMVNMHCHYGVPPYGQGDEAMREYCVRAKQDLLDHGINESDAEVFVIPSGTEGHKPNYSPSATDILMLKDYFHIVRGTGSFWTGAGYLYETGDSRERSYISYDRPQKWWTSALGITPTTNIQDKLARAKANHTVLSIYAHLGVTGDITLDQWKAVIDLIAAAQENGDIVSLALTDLY